MQMVSSHTAWFTASGVPVTSKYLTELSNRCLSAPCWMKANIWALLERVSILEDLMEWHLFQQQKNIYLCLGDCKHELNLQMVKEWANLSCSLSLLFQCYVMISDRTLRMWWWLLESRLSWSVSPLVDTRNPPSTGRKTKYESRRRMTGSRWGLRLYIFRVAKGWPKIFRVDKKKI